MGIIRIEGVEIYAHHGYHEEEQKLGSRFKIDLELESDTSQAEKTDNLNDTVNYQKVFEVLKVQMNERSSLLEHIASRILEKIMKDFEMVTKATIKITKLSPPINGKIDGVSVEISRDRNS